MRLVVGAAIIRHGCVLAARRTTPVEAAGRWEFPGGKVEPGESAESALVREIGEELGCPIEVTAWLGGSVPIRETHELRVATARLLGGEPVPHEHDAVRWLGPEDLDDIDWLDPDRPFLPQLRELLLDGEPLDGGNVGEPVRIGDTVRRPTGPWTPAVHALLDHLHAAGLRGVPRVHGLDARGREILDFLPGEVVDVDAGLVSEARLRSLARWTRTFRGAMTGFTHPGPWRMFDVGHTDRIGHNDLAPYNVCFDGDEVAGVFDWDFAGPTTAVQELAHQAWNAVPLFRDIGAEASARRLEALAAGYGDQSAADLLDAVVGRVRAAIDHVRVMAQSEEGAGLLAAGEPGRTERRLADLVERLPAIRANLRADLSSGSGA